MESAGLGPILERCQGFNFAGLDAQLETYEDLQQEDHKLMMQKFDQDILRDMSDPFDVYRAILSNIEGTDAYKYFLSAMQHLLLVREENETKSQYYQLIDTLVTSVVLDKKQSFTGGLSNTIGVSVERLVAQFGEQERAQAAQAEATEARVQLGRLKLEKESLEEELAQAGDGLVGRLKERLASTEEKLHISRQTTEALQAQLLDQQRSSNEQVQQLELQISELFKMLRESRGLASVIEASQGMDRKDLIYTISKQMERKKTIGILEGRHRKSPRAGGGAEDSLFSDDSDSDSRDDDDDDNLGRSVGEGGPAHQRRDTKKNRSRTLNPHKSDGMGRQSQFMDAEEERVRMHIEESLAAGAELMASSFWNRC